MVESPPLLRRTLARGGVASLSVALLGCFNPQAQDGDPTGDPATADPATGDPATADPTVTGEAGTTVSTSLPTTGEEPGTTTQPGCECPPETPYCTAMGCGTCNDLTSSNTSCAMLDADKPYCDAVSGLCAACTLVDPCEDGLHCHPVTHACVGCVTNNDCDDPENAHCDPGSFTCVPCEVDADCSGFGPTATCDPDKHRCRGCAEHSDCPETACDLATGACFPPGPATTHAYVDKITCNVQVDPPLCPMDQPCCEISKALKDPILALADHLVIHVKPGMYVAPVQVVVDGKRIAILGGEGVSLATADTEVAPLGLISGVPFTTALFVSRVNVIGSMPTVGVLCSQSSGGLWYEDAAVRAINGPGLFASACAIKARRAELVGNQIGVQASAGGSIHVQSSVIVGSHVGYALQAIDDGALDLLYTTVLDRDASANRLVSCGSEPITVRNSIVATAFVGGVLPGCTVMPTNSAFTPGVMTDPAPDYTLDPQVFSQVFSDWMNDDLHLLNAGSPILELARWQAGDPETDLDGKPRPTAPDTPDAAGAYLP